MGRMSRDKGRRGEQEVARIFRANGFDVDRVPNSGGLRVKGDLTGLDGFHVEVKRQEKLAIPAWLRQAHEEAGWRVPLVIFRQSKKAGNVGGWHAVLTLEALIWLLKERS